MSGATNDTQEQRLPSQAGLDMVASLISEPNRWNDWLSQHPDRWPLFFDNFRQIVRLEFATGWKTRTVLTELGCQIETTEELGEMEDEELETCLEYFKWVESLTEYLDTTAERRRILSEASLLFRDTQGDLSECKRSMMAGTFPGVELLKLGEIEKAWETARLQIGGTIGDRARMLRDTNPFVRSRPHLSDERLDDYLDPNGGIGKEMRGRISRHLKQCTECRNACEAREAACGPRRAVSAA